MMKLTLACVLLFSLPAVSFEYTEAELLKKVNESPQYVAVHDKAGWVGLFGDSGVVEDPVGTAIHHAQSSPSISMFYDAFIAPNQIHFEIEYDIVSGFNVVRKAVVVSQTPSGFAIRVPAFLLYQLHEETGSLKVKRMAAHWEMGPVSSGALGSGKSGLKSVADQAIWLFKHLGSYGSIKYFVQGLTMGVFEQGKRIAKRASFFLHAENENRFLKLFSKKEALIELPGEFAGEGNNNLKIMAPQEFYDKFKGGSFTLERLISSGYTTSFEFHFVSSANQMRQGIGIMHFTEFTKKISRIEFFY